MLYNATFYREKMLQKIFRGKALLLFLLLYSSYYNPITQDYQFVEDAVYDNFGVIGY